MSNVSFCFSKWVPAPAPFVDRFTLKALILNSPRAGRWVSTWRASRSTTPSTSEDPVVFLCTRAKVSTITWRLKVNRWKDCSLLWYKLSFSCLIWCLNFLSTGVFAIQPDKKSPAETKTTKHVGLIAGGTGERSSIQETDTSHLTIHLVSRWWLKLDFFSCSSKVHILFLYKMWKF